MHLAVYCVGNGVAFLDWHEDRHLRLFAHNTPDGSQARPGCDSVYGVLDRLTTRGCEDVLHKVRRAVVKTLRGAELVQEGVVPRGGGGEDVGVASELEELDGVLPGGGAGAVDEDWGGRIGRRRRGREGGVRECEVGCAEECPEGGDVVIWDGRCLFEWIGRWELRCRWVSTEAKRWLVSRLTLATTCLLTRVYSCRDLFFDDG